jgi:hypothetical protein
MSGNLVWQGVPRNIWLLGINPRNLRGGEVSFQIKIKRFERGFKTTREL